MTARARQQSTEGSQRQKAPLHMVEETPPLGSVWHEARGFESKVDVEVDAAGKEASSRKYIHDPCTFAPQVNQTVYKYIGLGHVQGMS